MFGFDGDPNAVNSSDFPHEVDELTLDHLDVVARANIVLLFVEAGRRQLCKTQKKTMKQSLMQRQHVYGVQTILKQSLKQRQHLYGVQTSIGSFYCLQK